MHFCLPALRRLRRPVGYLKELLKELRLLPYDSRLDAVEIEITNLCNLNCFNCDRSIGQAPSKNFMNLQQITKFVDESLALNWKWHKIRLLGGEPTLHPHFFEVLSIIKIYKDIFPSTIVEIVTNGFGKKVNNVLSKVPSWVSVINTSKKSPIQDFFTHNIAPVDLPQYKSKDFSKACFITEFCGIGLTRYGYYLCGAGGAMDRVFGFNIGIKNLAQVNRESLWKQRALLCGYCGHFKYTRNVGDPPNARTQQTSVSWQRAYDKYKTKKPQLTTY